MSVKDMTARRHCDGSHALPHLWAEGEEGIKNMRVLVACEESQAVTIEMRKLGHEAYSCDIIECSGGHPEWHIQQSVTPLLNGHCTFETVDGEKHEVPDKWDMILAFPPCTYLTVTGNRWFNVERYGEKAIQRQKDREEAIKFFMAFANADCPRIAIENPIGVMSTAYRKPNQIIHPYYFGDPERKATCLWTKGLPELKATDMVEPTIVKYKNGKGTDNPWHMDTMNLPPTERAKARSKTFPGIAKAMAEQWAGKAGPKESETDRSVSESNLLSDPEKEIMRGLLMDIGRKLEELEERIQEVLA